MASPTSSVTLSVDLILQVVATFAGGAGTANITVVNHCNYTVWPGAVPIGGGVILTPGQFWTIQIPPGTAVVNVWPRTQCSIGRTGQTIWASCLTGDCAGVMNCTVSATPPATMVLLKVGLPGGTDVYGISVSRGFNVPMDLSCSNGGETTLHCGDHNCADETQTCVGNSDYRVVLCP